MITTAAGICISTPIRRSFFKGQSGSIVGPEYQMIRVLTHYDNYLVAAILFKMDSILHIGVIACLHNTFPTMCEGFLSLL